VKPTPEILAYFPGKQVEITSYANLLASVAIERGLVGPKEADRIWERHIANCIPITTIIPQAVRVVDIGSGAGASWDCDRPSKARFEGNPGGAFAAAGGFPT